MAGQTVTYNSVGLDKYNEDKKVLVQATVSGTWYQSCIQINISSIRIRVDKTQSASPKTWTFKARAEYDSMSMSYTSVSASVPNYTLTTFQNSCSFLIAPNQIGDFNIVNITDSQHSGTTFIRMIISDGTTSLEYTVALTIPVPYNEYKYYDGTSLLYTDNIYYYTSSGQVSNTTLRTLPAKTGYTIKGWKDNSNTIYSSGGTYSLSQFSYEDQIFNAYYTVECSITLSKNNGNGGTSYIYTVKNEGVYLYSSRTSASLMTNTKNNISPPSRTNYTFKGYYSSSSGGTQYIDARGYITAAGNTAGKGYSSANTWYAQWEGSSTPTPTTYTLTASDSSGNIISTTGWTGSGTSATKSLTSGSDYGTLPNVNSRTNYTFDGWYTSSSGGSRVYTDTTMGNSNTTIYAQWTYNPPSSGNNYYSNRFVYGSYANSNYIIKESNSSGYSGVPSSFELEDDPLINLNLGWELILFRSDEFSAVTRFSDPDYYDSYYDVYPSDTSARASTEGQLYYCGLYARDLKIYYSLDHGQSIAYTDTIRDGYYCGVSTKKTYYGDGSSPPTITLRNVQSSLGWSLTPNGDVDFDNADEVTIEDLGFSIYYNDADHLEVILYAVFEEHYIDYVLGENGYFPEGQAHPSSMSFDEVNQTNNYIGIPEKPDYQFKGWNITGMDSGLSHHATDNFDEIFNSNSIFGSDTSATNITGPYFYNLSNTRGATVTFTAIWELAQRPGIHLNIGGLFQLAAPYIFCKKDSETVASWHQMEPYIFDGSSWHLCGESGAAAQIIKFTSISIDGNPTVATDDGTVYTITASPSNATNQQVTVTVDGDGYFGTNTSTQEQIVVLSGGSGTVTIKSNAQGTTSTGTITVRPVVADSDSVSASKSVTYAANVVKFSSITIEGDEPASALGTTYTVRATPTSATNQKVKIEITGPGYLNDIAGTTSQTITLSNGVGTFKITSTAQNTDGTGTITATPEAATSSDVKATKQINYSAIIVQFTSITISGSDTVPYDGTEYNIVATPSGAANQKVIITVSGDGYLESGNASATSKTITLSEGQGSFTVYSNSYSVASNQTITVTSEAISTVSTTKTVSYYPVICFIFYKTGGNDVTFSNSSYSKDGDGNIYYNNNSVWDSLTYNNSYNAKAVSTFSASKSGYALSGTYHAEQNTSLIVTPGTSISYANLMSGMVNNTNSSTGIHQQRLYLVLDWVENTQTLQETTETFRGFTLTEVKNVSSSKTWKASNGSSTTNLTVGAGYDNYISDQSDNTYYQAAHTGLGSDTFALTFAFNDTFQHTPVAISSLKLRCRMTRSISTNATKVTVNHYFYNSDDLDLSNLIMHFTTNNVTSTLQNVTWTRTIEDHETLITAFLGSLNGGKNINLKDIISVEIPSALRKTNTFKFYEMSLEVTYQYYA